MSIIPNLFGDLRRNFVRMIVGIPFMSEADIMDGKAAEMIEKFTFNPHSQFYVKNVAFKATVLKYFVDTWIH